MEGGRVIPRRGVQAASPHFAFPCSGMGRGGSGRKETRVSKFRKWGKKFCRILEELFYFLEQGRREISGEYAF